MLDAKLIRQRDADTIELTDGCVCCSLSAGLADAFDQLRERETAPDHVLVELSGVADPRRVVPWTNSPGFRLDAVVVLVDVDQMIERDDDPVTSPYLRCQIEAADLVVLTKADFATSQTVDAAHKRLDLISSATPVIEFAATTAIAAIIEIGTRRTGGLTDLPPAQLFDVHDISALPFPPDATKADLEAMLAELPTNVIRAKGIASGLGNRRFIVQKVGRRHSVSPLPVAEDQPTTDLVVIRAGRHHRAATST